MVELMTDRQLEQQACETCGGGDPRTCTRRESCGCKCHNVPEQEQERDFCNGYSAPDGCNVDASTNDCACARAHAKYHEGYERAVMDVAAWLRERSKYWKARGSDCLDFRRGSFNDLGEHSGDFADAIESGAWNRVNHDTTMANTDTKEQK